MLEKRWTSVSVVVSLPHGGGAIAGVQRRRKVAAKPGGIKLLLNDGVSFAHGAANALREQADRMQKCGPPQVAGLWTLQFDALNAGFEAIKPQIEASTVEGDRCVYIFELTDTGAVLTVREKMTEIVKCKRDKIGDFESYKCISQYNAKSRNSGVLYVGSSFATENRKATLSTRIKQHLGLSNHTTYAMHLAKWASGLQGGVQITVYQYPDETDRENVLAIEDYLSRKLDPLLGRRGRAR